MADSAFWHNLAAEFQRLHETYGALAYDWRASSGGVAAWKFIGSASGSIRRHFETLAIRAVSERVEADTPDLLTAWLEALRHEGYGLQSGETGSIYDVCEASANFCRTLESDALQAEFKEKHPAITLIPAEQAPTPHAKAALSSPREQIDRFILTMA